MDCFLYTIGTELNVLNLDPRFFMTNVRIWFRDKYVSETECPKKHSCDLYQAGDWAAEGRQIPTRGPGQAQQDSSGPTHCHRLQVWVSTCPLRVQTISVRIAFCCCNYNIRNGTSDDNGSFLLFLKADLWIRIWKDPNLPDLNNWFGSGSERIGSKIVYSSSLT